MGRRFGSSKLPYNQQTSWAGSISMFVFGLLVSIGSVRNQILYQNLSAIYGFWDSHENYIYSLGCCITIQFLDISNWIGS
jgi:dolichol kinase